MSDIVTTILVSAATSFSTKAIEGPIQTFNDIWKGSFGYKIQYWAESKRYSAEQNYKKYVSSIDEKVAKIKEENLQDPQLSIVGPALEASKYYIEEKEIREMFANLIASSMDSTYIGLVQHSFVEIIKQLSSFDAKLFSFLPNPMPFVTLIAQTGYNSSFNILVETCFFCKEFPNFTLNEIALNNLARLGLIQLTKGIYSNPNSYIIYKSKKFLDNFPNIPTKKITYQKHIIQITALGKAFKNVCIKDSL